MKLISTTDLPQREPQLQRDDWIVAGLRVLIDEGIDAVQITRLARDLDVTRGSFYWHFKGREDLLAALLAEWRARNTFVMVDVLEKATSLEAGILDLFFVWTDHSQFDPDLDLAVRNWGYGDHQVRQFVSAEDDNRIDAITRFFNRNGYPSPEAFIRARVIYFTQLSYYALRITEPMEERLSYLAAYFQCFTGRDIDDSVTEAFRTRLIKRETPA